MNQPKILAVFDYDHTLITGDSFWPFLVAVAGWPRTLMVLGEALAAFAALSFRHPQDAALTDFRTFVKGRLLVRLLAGRTPDSVRAAAEKTRLWQTWNESMRQTLLNHHAEGHHVVIASGALDLYLPVLARDLPHHAMICTQVEVLDGIITGAMPAGNCVRDGKAVLVKAYIDTHGPFTDSWGYGNFPHDVPMLNLVKQRVIV